jgi:hypothetical protein
LIDWQAKYYWIRSAAVAVIFFGAAEKGFFSFSLIVVLWLVRCCGVNYYMVLMVCYRELVKSLCAHSLALLVRSRVAAGQEF